MKIFFPDLIKTEKFLRNELSAEDSVVFQARLLLSERLRHNTALHLKVHRLVHLYHRRKLKADVESVQRKMFSDPAKRELIEKIMKHYNA